MNGTVTLYARVREMREIAGDKFEIEFDVKYFHIHKDTFPATFIMPRGRVQDRDLKVGDILVVTASKGGMF